MQERIFTLAEAREMLPRIEQLLLDIQRSKRKFDQVQALRDSIRRSTGADGGAVDTNAPALTERARALANDIRQQIEELNAAGVQVKDVDRGLVDWVAMREGRQVYLCWQRGEPTVDWWHEIADGFPGRRRVQPQEWD